MSPEKYRKRLEKKDIKALIKKATEVFHKFIRERDKGQPCISCGQFKELEAGHYYSAGKFRSLKFNPLNVNGQCKQCNGWLRGNLIFYGKGLMDKIGQKELDKLHVIAGMERQAGHYKFDRMALIELIMKYKQ